MKVNSVSDTYLRRKWVTYRSRDKRPIITLSFIKLPNLLHLQVYNSSLDKHLGYISSSFSGILLLSLYHLIEFIRITAAI